jgi:hypothetical protein
VKWSLRPEALAVNIAFASGSLPRPPAATILSYLRTEPIGNPEKLLIYSRDVLLNPSSVMTQLVKLLSCLEGRPTVGK